MAYNFDRTPSRRTTGLLNKWTWFPKDVLPMWIADMDFAAPPPILEALARFVEHGDMGYGLPSLKLLETVAERMDALYGWKVSPDEIVPIPGVNSGYNIAARTFCTPERGYLIQTPVYNEFHETRRKAGVPQIEAPLVKMSSPNRIRYEIDFDLFAKGASKASIFLLCNPHNPVGSIYSQDELKRMAQICIEKDLLIVSDEIHSELLLGDSRFQPIASLGREIERRTITLISASKAFNVPGLFAAFALIPNKKLKKRFEETNLKMGLHISNAGLVAALVAYSGRCDPWLKELRTYLTANRDFLVDYVTKFMPSLRVTVPEATFLAWLDCSELRLRPSPYEFFFKEARLALVDGAKFGKESKQFIRLNFGTSHRILREGLLRMRHSLGGESIA